MVVGMSSADHGERLTSHWQNVGISCCAPVSNATCLVCRPVETANCGQLLPKGVEREFALSGLLLISMKTELIELEEKSLSAGETCPRSTRVEIEWPNNAEISLHERLSGQFWEFAPTHEYSALND